jgi:metal-responsive CopG/Arc/MetJ family transcriptional regulator
MPTAEYKVYVSSSTLMAEIDEYCAENEVSASEAFRTAIKKELDQEDTDE